MPKTAKAGTSTVAARNAPVSKKPSQRKHPKSASGASSSTPAPKREPNRANYLILVQLLNSDDPTINRVLSVPPSCTIAKLHEVLQIAFGWANCHQHIFHVDFPTRPAPGEEGEESSTSLMALKPDPCFFENQTDEDEKDWTLKDIYNKPARHWKSRARALKKSDELDEDFKLVEDDGTPIPPSLHYIYDLHERWYHEIILLGRADSYLHKVFGGDGGNIICVGGEGHPCAERCGGSSGWTKLKRELFLGGIVGKDKEFQEWFKSECSNGHEGGLDPYEWDMWEVNAELKNLGEV